MPSRPGHGPSSALPFCPADPSQNRRAACCARPPRRAIGRRAAPTWRRNAPESAGKPSEPGPSRSRRRAVLPEGATPQPPPPGPGLLPIAPRNPESPGKVSPLRVRRTHGRPSVPVPGSTPRPRVNEKMSGPPRRTRRASPHAPCALRGPWPRERPGSNPGRSSPGSRPDTPGDPGRG